MTVAILLWVLLCAASVARAGEIADLHQQFAPGTPSHERSRSFDQVTATDHGVTEIGIERGACYGPCPVYTFVAKRDGTFRYSGVEHVSRKGEFTGTISLWQFNNLAQFMRDAGYMQLDDAYSTPVTDLSTVYTTAVINGERKVVRNYANAGPTKLWAIEELIDGLLATATWSQKPAPTESKK